MTFPNTSNLLYLHMYHEIVTSLEHVYNIL